MASTEPLVYLNGKLLPANQASLSIFDFGIVIGATITDLLRTFGGRPYRMDDHIRRFYDSCKYARIEPPVPPEECARITADLIAHNAALLPPSADLAVVYFITPGVNTMYAGSAGGSSARQPTLCIHSFPMPFGLFRNYFEAGVRLIVPSTRHIPPDCIDPKIKHRSRLHWWLAEREVKSMDPAAVPLLLDSGGNLTETSGANFLLVREGVVYSPTSRNILRGVSRNVVKEICRKTGIPFDERDLQVYDALTADEAFLVSTPFCIAPVVSVNGVSIGSGAVGGPVFETILAQWSTEVRIDIRAQFLAATE